MKSLSLSDIETFLQHLGNECNNPTVIYLLGGTALFLLGNPRSTEDIDYVGDDHSSPTDDFALLVKKLAIELDIEVEGVPIDGFLPIPDGSEQRHILIRQYGAVTVYVYDPYTIALSK